MFTFAHAYDLTKTTDIQPEELEPFMHPETRHLAADVIRVCNENGVSAEFIACLIRYERRMDINNLFGWTSNAGGLMKFGSDIESLEYCIPLIKTNYLEENGKYYKGVTIKDINTHYNGSDFWRDTMTAELNLILEAFKEPE